MQGRGVFFDGKSAARHEVRVALSEDRMALVIAAQSLPADAIWALSDLRATHDHAASEQIILTRHQDTDDEAPRDPARLLLDDPEMVAWLEKTRPNLYRRDVPKGTGKRLVRNALLSVSAVLVMLFVLLPAMANTLAGLIPLEREIAFGKSVTGQMERFLGGSELGDLRCEGAEGRAALDSMLERLTQGKEFDYDVEVMVFDHAMVNAFAAPGGQVVLMRGLLEEAPGPDAVAAVLAHEIGHVMNRDPTRAALRSVGSAGLLSLLLGDVSGGAVLVAMGEHLMNTSYSREAETGADTFALTMLNEAGISSEGLGAFFAQIAHDHESFRVPEYLMSHPEPGGRAERARQNAAMQDGTTPALVEPLWTDLKTICANREAL
ncbi:M48 family metallopeptidase [Primorskyibacter sp. S187A]|uniref:M48 family metallopeptidase n=1 Tax=Primorskyibacter sp. S187A TaxID=3415130 RepID=UPI003C7D7D55